MGVAEYASYGLFRLEARETIGIGQLSLFAHARFISHFSKNRQEEKRLPERAESASMLNTYPLGREMTQFKKPTLDEIDRVLAKHYGFTDEELDFIINYDIKYRMGR